ncbi:MAG: PmoA family protein [Verrucomicrobiia bacterium]
MAILMSLLCIHGLVAGAAEKTAASALGWEAMSNDTGLALINKTTSLPVWRAVCDPAQPKPYIYPLATIDGVELTANSPADHVWHHSLWFAWKYINGINYWEVDKKTGLSAGRTNIKSASFRRNDDFSARAEMVIEYAPPGQPPVLRETRVLQFIAPRADGSYAIDWDAKFSVGDADITLDRTPPKVKSGGYAGLSLRFPKGTTGWSFLTSEGAHNSDEGNGKSARWVDFSGPTKKGTVAGIAVFDHPANPRYPTPWYLNESHPYFSPALIYQKPMTLKAGAKMRLRYRILVHNDAGNAVALEREWKSFTKD